MKLLKTADEILKDNGEFKNYKLCFIDYIPKLISDYTPESKEYMARPDFSWVNEYKQYGQCCSPNVRWEEIPNPEYNEDDSTMEAYFLERDPKLVDGYDWRKTNYDLDFECSDWGEPIAKDDETLLVITFNLEDYIPGVRILYPQHNIKDVSAYDVNNGYCCWIWASSKTNSIGIKAGDNPYMFIQLINEIKTL